MVIATAPPTTAPPAPTRTRVRPKERLRVDPLGLGALLFAAIGFVAVLLLLRPGPPLPTTTAQLEMSRPAVLDNHHPVDTHDEPARTAGGLSLSQSDVHHPVDRHDQPLRFVRRF
jgi:hypothetical protein